MRSKSVQTLFRIQVVALLGLLFSNCGIVKPATSACSAGAAQITVTDNNLIRVCGCAEGGGAVFTTGLVCTVPRGTVMYFVYSNIQSAHHIVFNNYSIQFPEHDPASDGINNTQDVTTVNSTSTGLTFVDQIAGFTGTLLVQ
jgi:hypothetical protein